MFFLNKYWINRLKIKLKEKGFLSLLITIISFINKKINPNHVGEFPFKYLFLKKRRLIKNFANKELDNLDDINIVNIGNYLLNKSLVNNNTVVYTFGVGESISFEKFYQINFIARFFVMIQHH